MTMMNYGRARPTLYLASATLSSLTLWWSVGASAQQPPDSARPSATDPKPAASRSSAQIEAGEPRAATSPPHQHAATAASPSAGPKEGAKAASDRVDLGTATVTGDREQPKVMYIVPWKRSDIGDTSGKPLNSLLDEALAPVDRDEFKRQVAYYDALQAGASKQAAGGGTATSGTTQGEK